MPRQQAGLVLPSLQVRRQNQIAGLLASGCAFACSGASRQSTPAVSSPSTPGDSPDLVLHEVAFARFVDGRIAARGTARELVYRRAGGRLVGQGAQVALEPEPGSGLASFGTLRVAAPSVEGEVSGRSGSAQGGVTLDAARGDSARTERVTYDGEMLHGDRPVDGRGPGYTVHSKGISARKDGSEINLTAGVHGTLEVAAAAPSIPGAGARP